MQFNFKRFFSALLGGLLLSCFVTVQSANASVPVTYAYYGFDGQGPFSNFSIYTTWLKTPASGVSASGSNVYPAFQFWFENGIVGYTGTILQELKDGSMSRGVLFSIWDRDYDPATPPTATWDSATSPGCKYFGAEGTGVSCPLPNYNWKTGREYRLQVLSAGIDATGENWRGEITDMVTGVTTVMGVIHLANTPATSTTPSHTGYGRLTDSVTFLEYYSASNCTGNPASKVLWRGPFAENETYTAHYAWATYYSSCANQNVTTSTGRATAIHDISDNTQQTTAVSQDIWNPPLVTTQPVTSNTVSCAMLNATINTYGLADNLSFQYGTTTAFGLTTTNVPITSTTATSIASQACGLATNTRYYARAVGTYTDPANGAVYTTYGDTRRFTLDALGNITGSIVLPAVSTTGVSGIQQTTATLTGTVNTNGNSGGIYGLCKMGTGAYVTLGTKTLAPTNGPISVDLTGLEANMTYACHINARNHGSTTRAVSTPDVSFTTLVNPLVSPPVATTGTASSVTPTGATLNGTCNFQGAPGTSSAWFEYNQVGTTTYYNTSTQYFPASSTSAAITQAITGLSSLTSYNFRVHCSNAGGADADSPVQFTTPQ